MAETDATVETPTQAGAKSDGWWIVIQFIAWMSILSGIGAVCAAVIFLVRNELTEASYLMAAGGILQAIVMANLLRGKKWAKRMTYIYSVLWLVLIPIGTIGGIVMIFGLINTDQEFK